MVSDKITDRARGRWRDILIAVGVPLTILSGRHQACPFCGGKDRFRWDDQGGNGSYFCSRCGFGSGLDMVMKILDLDFYGAKAEVEKHIGSAKIETPKRAPPTDKVKAALTRRWQNSLPLNGYDVASRYLIGRGIHPDQWPSQLRYAPDAVYRHEDGKETTHHALIAKFVSPDTSDFTLQILYLGDDARKAQVPIPRRNALAKIPPGGAIRLAASGETLGVAEGIETAMSAMQRFGIPVWATTSAAMLQKFVPPSHVQKIVIFGDNDAGFAGQAAAFGLAFKLVTEKFQVEVRCAGMVQQSIGLDWNDIVQRERSDAELVAIGVTS